MPRSSIRGGEHNLELDGSMEEHLAAAVSAPLFTLALFGVLKIDPALTACLRTFSDDPLGLAWVASAKARARHTGMLGRD
jgi:hypothetical protein